MEEVIPKRQFLTEETEFFISAPAEKVSLPGEHLPLSCTTQEEEEAVVSHNNGHLFGQGNGEFLDSIFTSQDKRASPTGFLMMTSDSIERRRPTRQPLIVEIDDCGAPGDKEETERDALVQSCDMVEQLTVTDELDSVE